MFCTLIGANKTWAQQETWFTPVYGVNMIDYNHYESGSLIETTNVIGGLVGFTVEHDLKDDRWFFSGGFVYNSINSGHRLGDRNVNFDFLNHASFPFRFGFHIRNSSRNGRINVYSGLSPSIASGRWSGDIRSFMYMGDTIIYTSEIEIRNESEFFLFADLGLELSTRIINGFRAYFRFQGQYGLVGMDETVFEYSINNEKFYRGKVWSNRSNLSFSLGLQFRINKKDHDSSLE